MLLTKMKSTEDLLPNLKGKVFVITCHGCKEVNVSEAEQEAEAFFEKAYQSSRMLGLMAADYICNPAYLKDRVAKYADKIQEADTIVVFSCGVGVQTIAEAFPDKRVCAGNDTYALPGFQGITPLEHDCDRCGQCYLNLTGGICPITACSKSLINGQCGGAKNGMCEVDPNMECGWERIIRKLTELGRLDVLKAPVQLRDYSVDPDL